MSRFPRSEALLLLSLLGLYGCSEFVEYMVEDAELSYCPTCDWIVQVWDNPGWSTHNSDPYDTELLCEESLAQQSAENRDTGFRCIHESDLLDEKEVIYPKSEWCHGCDWAIEVQKYGYWERAEMRTTHRSEGRCMQALWHLHKKNDDENYRCRNLDAF